ncbi:hypothetical protein ACFWWM_15620 [Streptomyces sp. NPDC058682]|nr:hypothetical protein [Streptomyces sp. NBC_01214]MCX4801230.1 hypothetical protein [Streptomyces sp. NBC_01214]
MWAKAPQPLGCGAFVMGEASALRCWWRYGEKPTPERSSSEEDM